MLDVLFLCEGTYPYVAGGVSSWLHSLITGMPEKKFGIVYLATSQKQKRILQYELPDNLRDMVEFYLYDMVFYDQPTSGSKGKAWREIAPFLEGILTGDGVGFEPACRHLARTKEGGLPTLSMTDLARSKESWDLLLEVYRRNFPNASFSDFFWSWRYTHLPLFKLFACELPPARVYHSVTTGWCGLLGAIARQKTRRPFLLTEHGLYVNERRIEISQADWIYVDAPTKGWLEVGLGTFKEMWMNLFLALARICYKSSDHIYTLHSGNRKLQIEYGAPADKIEIIPNGVDVKRFSEQVEPALPRHGDRFRVGFVGRVVPIKDVKTFLKACRIVSDEVPELQVYLCGPTDEDPEYYGECRTMADALGLQDQVHFTGRVDARSYYPCFDVQVLTSISEGQPLVVLEGFCTGLPAVATDVGSCRELIEGRNDEDRALGPAGMVTWVGNPRQTADCILELYHNPELRKKMGEAGRERVRRYYQRDKMIDDYRQLYEDNMELPEVQPVGAGV